MPYYGPDNRQWITLGKMYHEPKGVTLIQYSPHVDQTFDYRCHHCGQPSHFDYRRLLELHDPSSRYSSISEHAPISCGLGCADAPFVYPALTEMIWEPGMEWHKTDEWKRAISHGIIKMFVEGQRIALTVRHSHSHVPRTYTPDTEHMASTTLPGTPFQYYGDITPSVMRKIAHGQQWDEYETVIMPDTKRLYPSVLDWSTMSVYRNETIVPTRFIMHKKVRSALAAKLLLNAPLTTRMACLAIDLTERIWQVGTLFHGDQSPDVLHVPETLSPFTRGSLIAGTSQWPDKNQRALMYKWQTDTVETAYIGELVDFMRIELALRAFDIDSTSIERSA